MTLIENFHTWVSGLCLSLAGPAVGGHRLSFSKKETQSAVLLWDWLIKSRLNVFNPYKPSILFMGHQQTVQNQIRRRRTRRLIRFLTQENFISVIIRLKRNFMGLGPGFLGCLTSFPPLCQQATSIQCVKYGDTYTGKIFCWHTGGGGNDILKNVFWFLYTLMQNWLFYPKFYIFEAFNIENGFHCQKVLRSGYLHSEERDNWQTFIFTQNHRDLPIASVNDSWITQM